MTQPHVVTPAFEANPYDAIPYPGYPRREAHPNRLAAVGIWNGMSPAPVNRCRVLELGCGDGAHLLPMAMTFPESWFVGIDMADSAIQQGRKTAEALGLRNIEFRRLDILKVGDSFGEFDYIIAHGLYSWTPPPVRDRIFALCRERLSPHGIAYISYNTLPGCYSRLMLRDMLMFHTSEIHSPRKKVDQARSLLTFLRDGRPEGDLYGLELDQALKTRDASIFHDDMAPVNEPVYFYQFMRHASRHGLQYIGDADLVETWACGLPPQVQEQLRDLDHSDILLKAQYLDFLRCGRFRRTLLCCQEVSLDRNAKPHAFARLYATLRCERQGVQRYRNKDEETIRMDHPVVCAALDDLNDRYPEPVSCAQLIQTAGRRCGVDPVTETARIRELFEYLWAFDFIQLHAEPPRFATTVAERPLASPLARLQVAQGSPTVSNLAHTTVDLKHSLARHVLQLCDGTRDRDAIAEALGNSFRKAGAVVTRDGVPVGDWREAIGVVQRELDSALAHLAELALLSDAPRSVT